MARVHARNVSHLDGAVDFSSKLFSAKPAKRRHECANFVHPTTSVS